VPAGSRPAVTQRPASPPAFAHYYLWWTDRHWRNKLGGEYPYASLPLPAQLQADGCTATTPYAGNTLLDVPDALYDLDDEAAATFDRHIREAVAAGLDGFVVAWPGGGGTADQSPDSSRWNRRLDEMVKAVRRFNAAGGRFRLILGYESQDESGIRPIEHVRADLAYFVERYGEDAAFRVPGFERRPIVIWMHSRWYPVNAVRSVHELLGSSVLLAGNEHRLDGWRRGVAPYLDGTHWYWSSQDPYRNPQSFEQVDELADELHRQGKLWLAPLAGGFNISNFGLGDVCVPRNDGETLRRNYAGNLPSEPDIWIVISWNEFLENTYLQPTQRHGTRYTEVLRELLGG
jgi:hypothetical protein